VSLEVKDCSVALAGTVVLSEVSATVGPGQWLGVIGPNGAGKSTLVRAILGLVPFTGAVRALGVDLARGTRRQWARLVSYVPQRPVLPASMSVTDYVLLGRSAHHPYLGAETARDRRATATVLDRLDLAALAGRQLGHLSGGELQRAVLARALVQEAPVLVMDEPTTSLDLGHSQMVLDLADELRREQGLTVLCALHDLTLAGQYSDHLLVICEGRSVLAGPPAQVLTRPNLERFFEATVSVVDHQGRPAVLPARRRRPAGGPAASGRPAHPEAEAAGITPTRTS